jgi:hypothetical protein
MISGTPIGTIGEERQYMRRMLGPREEIQDSERI